METNKFLITEENPIFQKVYKKDMLFYSFIDKKYIKDYFLAMTNGRLVDYLRYELRTGLKWRLMKYINGNPYRYYGKIISHIVVNIHDELIFGLDKNFHNELLENEIILNIIVDLLEYFTKIYSKGGINETNR